MALTNAEKQRRWRQKRSALGQTDPRAIESALLQEVERCERGELSDQERIALADRLTEMAKQLLWRSHELSQIAFRLRTGSDHPLQP
jgi:hypothetical protein